MEMERRNEIKFDTIMMSKKCVAIGEKYNLIKIYFPQRHTYTCPYSIIIIIMVAVAESH